MTLLTLLTLLIKSIELIDSVKLLWVILDNDCRFNNSCFYDFTALLLCLIRNITFFLKTFSLNFAIIFLACLTFCFNSHWSFLDLKSFQFIKNFFFFLFFLSFKISWISYSFFLAFTSNVFVKDTRSSVLFNNDALNTL